MRQACTPAVNAKSKNSPAVNAKSKKRIAGQRTSERARLDEVFVLHKPRLYYAADRLIRNPADSEDALQEGLLAAFRHVDQFRGDSNLSTWVNSIVTNAARMQLRKRSRLRETSIPDDSGDTTNDRSRLFFVDRRPDPEQECARKERSRLLAERMKDLSPQSRSVVQLCVIDGLLLREAAQKLGVPTGTVKARLHRARKLLARTFRRPEFRICSASRSNQIA